MLAISLNDVPGWLVTIPPSAIGVPVATTPGLVPHCEVVLTAVAGLLVLDLGVGLLVGEPLLPHPATADAPIAASAMVARYADMRLYIPIPTSGW